MPTSTCWPSYLRSRARGIAQRLVKLGMESAARRGYRFAVTEANAPLSQHIFSKLGFQERDMVSYKDLRFEDRPVFASIESTRGIMLMAADIQSQPGA